MVSWTGSPKPQGQLSVWQGHGALYCRRPRALSTTLGMALKRLSWLKESLKVISEMLGHADVTTTLRIYAHVIPSMQEQAAGAMDRLFREKMEIIGLRAAYSVD